MKRTTIFKASLFSAAAVLLAACSASVQTTSGQSYLDRYSEQTRHYQPRTASVSSMASETSTGGLTATAPGTLAPDIAMAASVKPILEFPAHIGLVRLEDGRLSTIPPAEVKSWRTLAERLGPEFGELVPISPLIIGLATQEIDARMQHGRDHRSVRGGGLIHDIRIGAARQHTDAVLIYETSAKSENTSNPLAVTKLLLVGFWLAPTQYLEATATASALLVDVRNGYTYGTALGIAGDPASTLSTSVNEREAIGHVEYRSKARAVAALTKEVEQLARDLRVGLAESRVARFKATQTPQ